MKHNILFSMAITMALFPACKDEPAATNPLPVALGDPFLLKASDGKFYLYGTTGEERVVFIDPMEILPDGQLVVYGHT